MKMFIVHIHMHTPTKMRVPVRSLARSFLWSNSKRQRTKNARLKINSTFSQWTEATDQRACVIFRLQVGWVITTQTTRNESVLILKLVDRMKRQRNRKKKRKFKPFLIKTVWTPERRPYFRMNWRSNSFYFFQWCKVGGGGDWGSIYGNNGDAVSTNKAWKTFR